MDDLIEHLVATTAAEAAASKLARRHRWFRIAAFLFRLLVWAAILAAVVLTFVHYDS